MVKFSSTITFVFLLLVVITACRKDEEPVDPIVGTWEYSENSKDFSRTITLTFYADKSGISKDTYVVFGEPDIKINNFTYLTKNGILTLIMGYEITDSLYSISENQLTTTYRGEVLVFTRK